MYANRPGLHFFRKKVEERSQRKKDPTASINIQRG